MTKQQPIGDLPEDKVAQIRRALWASQQLMTEIVEHPALAMQYGRTMAWGNLVSTQGGLFWDSTEDKRISPTARVQHALATELAPTKARGLPKAELIEHVKLERLKGSFRQRLLASAVELLIAHPSPELPGVQRDLAKYKDALSAAAHSGKRRPTVSAAQGKLL